MGSDILLERRLRGKSDCFLLLLKWAAESHKENETKLFSEVYSERTRLLKDMNTAEAMAVCCSVRNPYWSKVKDCFHS